MNYGADGGAVGNTYTGLLTPDESPCTFCLLDRHLIEKLKYSLGVNEEVGER